MKKTTLIASIICDNILSYVLSFVLWAIIVYLLLGTSSLVRSYYEAVDLAESSGLDHKVLVSKSLICEFSFDDDFEQTLETISELPGVNSCTATAFGSFFSIDRTNGLPFNLDPILEAVYGKMRYPLVSGKWPSDPCEVALAENMMRNYRIGDKIPVRIYFFSGTPRDKNYELIDGELTVTGFLHMDAQMINFWSVGDHFDLSHMSTTLSSLSPDGDINNVATGVVVPPTDASGQPMRFDSIAHSLIISAEPGIHPQQIKRALSSLFPEDHIQIGKVLIERYHVSHRFELIRVLRNLFIVSFLAISTFFSSVFLQLRRKKLEMTVYYICGVTWQQSIGFFCVVYIPILLLSFISGSTVFMAFNENPRWFDGKDSWLILFAVSFLFILPLYILARRSSPVEQTRKD